MASEPAPVPEPTEPDEPRRAKGGGLTLRIATGLTLAGLIFGTLFTSRPAWFGVVATAVLIAQWELYRALGGRGAQPASALGVSVGAVLLLGAFVGGADNGLSAMSFALTLAVIGTFLWFLAEPDRTGAADRIAMTLLGIAYVPFLGAHVWLIRDLPDGPVLTVSYIGLVAFYDIGAFAFGSMIGRHPIAPRISPRKTWEGAGGATVFIFVVAIVVGPIIGPFDAGSAAMLAAVVAVVAPLGDLAESLIKRDLDIKDMGTLLPGHGGLLDRIDALLLVAPAAYWLMRGVVV